MGLNFSHIADYAHTHGFIFKKTIKYIGLIFLIGWASWSFLLKTPIYQRLYGTKTQAGLSVSDADIFTHLTNPAAPLVIKGRDYAVQVTFLKKYQTTAKIVYIDRYNFIGTWYRGDRFSYLYDSIVPLDISTVSGKTARPEILKHFEFKHEYRLLWSQSNKWNELFVREDINNNHIIPANKNIKKALEILKSGDIAHMEGYLVHLNGLRDDNNFELQSALTLGEISKQKAGGQTTGLCRVIYLTKIIFNGYEFE